jgi:hypothetical protein
MEDTLTGVPDLVEAGADSRAVSEIEHSAQDIVRRLGSPAEAQ